MWAGKFVKPRRPSSENPRQDLFRVELARIVDPGHGMVRLAEAVGWDRMDEVFGETDNGRPAVSTRLLAALHYLKYTHNLSEVVRARADGASASARPAGSSRRSSGSSSTG